LRECARTRTAKTTNSTRYNVEKEMAIKYEPWNQTQAKNKTSDSMVHRKKKASTDPSDTYISRMQKVERKIVPCGKVPVL